MLHIMRHSYTSAEFKACIQQLDTHSHLLLIEEAVYALVKPSADLTALAEQQRLSVLSADMQARGVVAEQFEVVDYLGLVALTEQHTPCLTW